MVDFAESMDLAAATTLERLLDYLPQLLGAFALLLAGWLLARLLRALTRRAAALLDNLLKRSTGPSRWRLGTSTPLLGTVVYWVVLLFFITAAAHTLGLQTFGDWMSRLLDHLPALAAGLLIAFAGYVLSGFVGEVVNATATGLAPLQRGAVARLAKWSTLALALLIGADQIGLKVTWLAIFAAVLIASVMGGLALAASLGARGYVANLIGAHHLRQALELGQFVRVAGHQGRIVALSATSLVLETADGRVLLPGSVYHDEAIVVMPDAAVARSVPAGPAGHG